MKKCILIVMVLLSLSCSLYNEIADYSYESRIQKADIYYLDEFYGLDSIWDISNYLNEHIVYKADDWDEWSSVEATLARGYGDCEDFAIAFMNIYYVVFNEKCDLYVANSVRCILIEKKSVLFKSSSFQSDIPFYNCFTFYDKFNYVFTDYFNISYM